LSLRGQCCTGVAAVVVAVFAAAAVASIADVIVAAVVVDGGVFVFGCSLGRHKKLKSMRLLSWLLSVV